MLTKGTLIRARLPVWGAAGSALTLLPNDNILDWSKFKAFADDKINVKQQLKFGWRRAKKKIVEKGENAGYQHFLLFPQCFQKVSFSGSLKVRIVWQRVNLIFYYLRTTSHVFL